jgi:predicted nucleic acid-binding protein
MTVADVLVDTSAWISALRGSDERVQRIVDGLLADGRLVFCGVVELEILHGMRSSDRKRVLPLFSALPYIEVDREDWRAAGDLLRDLRQKGITIPMSDALIGTLCLRHGLSLLTLDGHFEAVKGLRRVSVE